MIIPDNFVLPVKCPRCGEQFQKPFGWLKDRTRVECPECGANLCYQKDAILRDAEEIFSGVSKTMGGLKRID